MPQPDGAPRQGIAGLGVQASLILGSVALVLAPPVGGAMLIAPLVPTAAATTVNWAVAAGATLIAPGPYPGSLIVNASRSALLAGALSHGALLLTTRFTSCTVADKGL